MTRSTLARIIRYGQQTGSLPAGTSPVGMAAYARGFVRGLAARRRRINGA